MHAGPCAGALEAAFINPTPGHDLPIFCMFRHGSPSAQFKVSEHMCAIAATPKSSEQDFTPSF